MLRALRSIDDHYLPTTLNDFEDGYDDVARDCRDALHLALHCHNISQWTRATQLTRTVIVACEDKRSDVEGWANPSWQESIIFAHFSAAALYASAATQLADAAAQSLVAMEHVDSSIMLGAPEELWRPFVAFVEPLAKLCQARARSRSCDYTIKQRTDPLWPLDKRVSIPHIPSSDVTASMFRSEFWKANKAVILKGLASDWPASTKWANLAWWAQEHGHRTVPLEVGTIKDGDWREETASLLHFIEQYMVASVVNDTDNATTQYSKHLVPSDPGACGTNPNASADAHEREIPQGCTHGSWGASILAEKEGPDGGALRDSKVMGGAASFDAVCSDSSTDSASFALHQHSLLDSQELDEHEKVEEDGNDRERDGHVRMPEHRRGHRVAYLAQYCLFQQIPALVDDIRFPACWKGAWETSNIWMGTSGTVTPLHFDSMDNFLCQVAGVKYVRLYARSETPYLYPDDGSRGKRTGKFSNAQGNISLVDIERPDLDAYPDFAGAKFTEAILRPGDALYIPAKCWHFVRSLSTSISVNFWF